MRKLALFSITLLLSGCMMGPHYRRPCIDVPESYMYEVADAGLTLDLAWWKEFEDPVLEELISEALSNNNDVKAAAANIEAAIGILIQTRSPLFPQIGYQDSYSKTLYSDTVATSSLSALGPGVFTNPETTWQAVVTGSLQLDFWGRIRSLVQAAQANMFAAYEERQSVILALVTAVANNYITLRGLDEQLAIAKRTLQTYSDSVRYFELQFHYGQKSQMSVAQAQTQYAGAAAKIPQIEAKIAEVENVLNVLLSRNPQHIPRGKSIYDLQLPAVPAGIPSDILCQRPDVLQAEMNLIAANAEIGAARALYFPTVSLTGYYGGASQELTTLFSGPSRTWNYTGSIVGPIFTGGAVYGQVVQAESLQQAALYTYKQIVERAFGEVETALNTHAMLNDQLKAQTLLVGASGEYTRLSTLQFLGGYSPYFVVIQAQEQYFPAELEWAKVRTEVFTSLISIYQAMGGGWVDIAEKMTHTWCENDEGVPICQIDNVETP